MYYNKCGVQVIEGQVFCNELNGISNYKNLKNNVYENVEYKQVPNEERHSKLKLVVTGFISAICIFLLFCIIGMTFNTNTAKARFKEQIYENININIQLKDNVLNFGNRDSIYENVNYSQTSGCYEIGVNKTEKIVMCR